jgi:hypothetical protein
VPKHLRYGSYLIAGLHVAVRFVELLVFGRAQVQVLAQKLNILVGFYGFLSPFRQLLQ